MYLNQAIIVGRLTRDPELKALASGTKVAGMSVATNMSYKDSRGEKKETTEFHNIVVFGNQADSCGQYLKKGQEVLVIGRIQTRSWDDATSGEKRYRTEIVADKVQFGSKTHGQTAETASRSDSADESDKPPAKAKKEVVGATGYEYPTEDINPEDIPF